jgi:hypothetical protein
MAYDQTIINQFIELRSRRVPYSQIAADLKITKATLIKWGDRYKAQIDAMAAVEAEAVRHKYLGSRDKEIEMLAKRIARIEAEIDQRDPGYMATRELTDLLRVTRTRLDKLCVEPTLPEDPATDADNPNAQPHA